MDTITGRIYEARGYVVNNLLQTGRSDGAENQLMMQYLIDKNHLTVNSIYL